MRKDDVDENLVSLRSATAADADFLAAVYLETRRRELAALGWSESQLREFCRMQFDLQKRAYKMQFPAAREFVVESGGEPCGRFIVAAGDAENRLIDILILPEFRNRGVGAAIVGELQREAVEAGKTLVLRVANDNAHARRFYERLGFAAIERTDIDLTMRFGQPHNQSQTKEL